jgi:hypothetical protein
MEVHTADKRCIAVTAIHNLSGIRNGIKIKTNSTPAITEHNLFKSQQ